MIPRTIHCEDDGNGRATRINVKEMAQAGIYTVSIWKGPVNADYDREIFAHLTHEQLLELGAAIIGMANEH